jgi:hypothetical protein
MAAHPPGSLEFSPELANNGIMEMAGHVHNGIVVLDGGTPPPEGAPVRVVCDPPAPTSPRRPVVLPIFDYDGPPDIDLTNERIADILDREDASA